MKYVLAYLGSSVKTTNFNQLLDEAFVISGIIKVEVHICYQPNQRLRLVKLTRPKTLIIPEITKTESNNCFIIHCINNDKYIITPNQFDIALGNHALREQPTD